MVANAPHQCKTLIIKGNYIQGKGGIWEFSVFSAQFFFKSKTDFKYSPLNQ